MGKNCRLEQRKKSSRCSTRFAARWEQTVASNKERNRVVVRLDFDVKSAAASGKPHCGWIRRRPTLPGRFQPSTISVLRLNFCVRYGNRWNPQAIITGNCMRGLVCAGRSECSGCSGLSDDLPYWTIRLFGFADSHPLSQLPCQPSDSLSSVGFAPLAFLRPLRFSDSLTLFALP